MRFLRRIEGVTLFNKVCSSEIQKSLNIESLLLRIERSQLRWFGHVNRIPQERLPKQALLAKVKGKGRWDDHQHAGKITLRILDGTTWGWKWWQTVMCGGLILSCCPCNPNGHERALKEEEEEELSILSSSKISLWEGHFLGGGGSPQWTPNLVQTSISLTTSYIMSFNFLCWAVYIEQGFVPSSKNPQIWSKQLSHKQLLTLWVSTFYVEQLKNFTLGGSFFGGAGV